MHWGTWPPAPLRLVRGVLGPWGLARSCLAVATIPLGGGGTRTTANCTRNCPEHEATEMRFPQGKKRGRGLECRSPRRQPRANKEIHKHTQTQANITKQGVGETLHLFLNGMIRDQSAPQFSQGVGGGGGRRAETWNQKLCCGLVGTR
jgi:hypothetical protein